MASARLTTVSDPRFGSSPEVYHCATLHPAPHCVRLEPDATQESFRDRAFSIYDLRDRSARTKIEEGDGQGA